MPSSSGWSGASPSACNERRNYRFPWWYTWGVGRTGWPRIRKEAEKDGVWPNAAARAKVEAVGNQDRKEESRVDAVVTFGRLPGLAPTGPEAARTDAELIREAQANSHVAFETL